MYRITVENLDEPGSKPAVFEDVFTWGCLTKEDIEMVEEDLSEYEGTEIKLTDDEVDEVKHRLERFDDLPTMSDLRSIIKDILDDRE